MTTSNSRADRRIRRTQQVLRQAFLEVLQEKGFAGTSIQDITERANVNRGTFYTHFADKYALLDTVMREMFHQHIASKLPSVCRWDRQTLYLLILAVLENFEGKYRHQHRPTILLAEVAPLLERATQEELADLLYLWLQKDESIAARGNVPLETMARVVSWAIFGPALQWSQEQTTMSAEQMAQHILLVIAEGVASLAPEVLPEGT
jgi:AcrR family transcriptional regulator